MAKILGKYIADDTITENLLSFVNSAVGDYIIAWDNTEQKFKWIEPSGADTKDVKVSASDTTPGFLSGKLVEETDEIILTVLNPGANETLKIGVGANVLKTSNTTDDLNEGSSNLYYTDARVDSRITAQKGNANGIAPLGADSKINSAYLPAIAITETFVVADEAAQLALTVQRGDVAVRTDENKSYIALNDSNASMSDWQELLTPTDAVLSVNGQTGAVTLSTDNISEGSTNLYFTEARARNSLSGGTGINYNSTTGEIALEGAVGEAKKVEIFTLASGDITNKYVDLAQIPATASAVEITPVGGILQEYATDFSIISDGADLKRLNWNGLGLENLLASGDKLIVNYTY